MIKSPYFVPRQGALPIRVLGKDCLEITVSDFRIKVE